MGRSNLSCKTRPTRPRTRLSRRDPYLYGTPVCRLQTRRDATRLSDGHDKDILPFELIVLRSDAVGRIGKPNAPPPRGLDNPGPRRVTIPQNPNTHDIARPAAAVYTFSAVFMTKVRSGTSQAFFSSETVQANRARGNFIARPAQPSALTFRAGCIDLAGSPEYAYVRRS